MQGPTWIKYIDGNHTQIIAINVYNSKFVKYNWDRIIQVIIIKNDMQNIIYFLVFKMLIVTFSLATLKQPRGI